MRIRNDPPEVFGVALCGFGFGCGKKWEKWCRGCNLVYCTTHVDMKIHKCKRMDLERGCPGTFGPPEKPKKMRKPKPEAKDPSCEKPVSPPTLPSKKDPPCEETQLSLMESPKEGEKRDG